MGIIAWIAVTNQLTAENITIPDDAVAIQGQQVTGPITAYIQADIINHHALEATGGQDVRRAAAGLRSCAPSPCRPPSCGPRCSPRSSRTASRCSPPAIGVLAILFGWAFIRLASAPVVVKQARIS